jgi:hypothetical protein
MLEFLPVTLSNMDRYASSFTPPTVTHKVPKHLTTVFDRNLEGKSASVVDEECERLFQLLSITKAEQDAVELVTRNQSTCEEWGNQRGGRITGTKICRVTKLDFSKNLTPGSKQFIIELCYPEIAKFSGNK